MTKESWSSRAEKLPPVLVDLALWVADYYGSTPGRALELIAPVKRKRRKQQAPPGERQALVDESEAPELTAEQRAAHAMDDGEFGGRYQQFLATGARSGEVHGGEHPAFGEFAVQPEFRVAGALEFLEEHRVGE